MRDDEFMDESPKRSFGRGKSKVVALKPWQAHVDGEVKATNQRCWDGLTGCEGYKPKSAFRLHPMICDQCAEPMVHRFGITRSDMELLANILQMDSGMYVTARRFGATPEKIQAMEVGRDRYISQFINTIKPLRNRFEIEAKTKSFRDWFFSQAGAEFPQEKLKSVKGFASLAEVAA